MGRDAKSSQRHGRHRLCADRAVLRHIVVQEYDELSRTQTPRSGTALSHPLCGRQSAKFLYQSWKRFRKYNAYATGITQNAQDCLTNDTACAVLSNSEFVVMLRQTKDILPLRKLYGLSEPQQEYLKLATAGQGILKMGNNIIPFENKQPTTGKVYKLISTKPGEVE